jgi:hypothetical protein
LQAAPFLFTFPLSLLPPSFRPSPIRWLPIELENQKSGSLVNFARLHFRAQFVFSQVHPHVTIITSLPPSHHIIITTSPPSCHRYRITVVITTSTSPPSCHRYRIIVVITTSTSS